MSQQAILKEQARSPDHYLTIRGELYERPPLIGRALLPVLQYMNGKPWDEIALSYCHSVRPTFIRVTRGAVTEDWSNNRLTIYLNDDGVTIKRCEQECEIGLLVDGMNGEEMGQMADAIDAHEELQRMNEVLEDTK